MSYCVCVLPASVVSWGQFDLDGVFPSLNWQLITTSIFNIIYWCMFSINFIIYLICFNTGIKKAYGKFFEDMKQKVFVRNNPSPTDVLSLSIIDSNSVVHTHYKTELAQEWSL